MRLLAMPGPQCPARNARLAILGSRYWLAMLTRNAGPQHREAILACNPGK